MRQYNTNNGIIIQYTDEIWMAFLPCLVKVDGGSTSRVQLDFADDDGKTMSYSVDAFRASSTIDYREFVQAYFDGIVDADMDYTQEVQYSRLGKELTIAVSVYSESGTLMASMKFSTFFAWGSLRLGETWNGSKKLTWFKNYPFSFGIYASGETQLLVGFDSQPSKLVTIGSAGMVNVCSSALPSKARYSTIYLFDGTIEQATFDGTFDLTFAKVTGTQKELLCIDIRDEDKGTYLRWIDRHGFVRYWLFAEGDESRTISSDGEFLRDNLQEYPSGRRQSYQREDEVALCAPLVDSETFDFLQDVASSPYVERYLGGDVWEPVTIKAGTYTKSTAPLQDFVCNMVLDNTNIQSL